MSAAPTITPVAETQLPAAPPQPSEPPLLTAEQFGARPDPGHPEELVKGRIVAMSPPNRRHGQVCNKVGRLLGNFADDRKLGHVLSNDAGIITTRDPDTVRGADVAFYSFNRLPQGPLPRNYGPEAPEIVFEVRSPSDKWSEILKKVGEYLGAGVELVVILDDEKQSAQVFDSVGTRSLTADDPLDLSPYMPGLKLRVGAFFE